MEKYYRVESGSDIEKGYFQWKENAKKINDAFKELAEENEIETKEYYPSIRMLWIVPTKNDLKKFEKQLKKTWYGVFKKTSDLSKKWIEKCKNNLIIEANKPCLLFRYCIIGGRSKERIFDINGVVYATIDCSVDFEINDTQLNEIKASEFYKIIEENGIILK